MILLYMGDVKNKLRCMLKKRAVPLFFPLYSASFEL